ncbi:longitudinals lacking protein, isoforms A/B/D/L-like [Macrosteles quadrilineatus]|uniref:longitudinals lacking protein, isoforms A/B/D/L-like n=1 Tax=Macrosteles quadrilineatus TaxID=74068 RepID=UPI0023E32499|nr:longitudinals lacking protein, isoforms A/B/D/L-like [Macrosteles quadrilineatus]
MPADHFLCTPDIQEQDNFEQSLLAKALQKEPDDIEIEIDPSATEVKIWDYQCPQCGNTFAQKRYLAFHLKNTCQKEPRYFCAMCTAKYKKKYDLESHILHKHMDK